MTLFVGEVLETGVRDDDALGSAGRARGVDEVGGVLQPRGSPALVLA